VFIKKNASIRDCSCANAVTPNSHCLVVVLPGLTDTLFSWCVQFARYAGLGLSICLLYYKLITPTLHFITSWLHIRYTVLHIDYTLHYTVLQVSCTYIILWYVVTHTLHCITHLLHLLQDSYMYIILYCITLYYKLVTHITMYYKWLHLHYTVVTLQVTSILGLWCVTSPRRAWSVWTVRPVPAVEPVNSRPIQTQTAQRRRKRRTG